MRRLKPDLLPAALIRKILEAGVSAPSGGNRQRWRFLVTRDPKDADGFVKIRFAAWNKAHRFDDFGEAIAVCAAPAHMLDRDAHRIVDEQVPRREVSRV
jgi:nitroreductase